MKKLRILLFAMILSIVFSACTNPFQSISNSRKVISPRPEDQSTTLTILLHPNDYYNINTNSFYRDYIYRFQKDFGVEIKYEQVGRTAGSLIDEKDEDEYIKKLSTKLVVENGPELIFSESMGLEPMIAQGVVVKLNDKIPNLNKIYKGLLEPEVGYVPVTMNYTSRLINLEALGEIGLEIPDLTWTTKDRFDIRTKWLAQGKAYFNSSEWNVIFDALVDLEHAYNPDENKIYLNTNEMKQQLANAKEYVLEGNYVLDKKFKLKNIYNMLYEEDSQEFKQSFDLFLANVQSNTIEAGVVENLFRAVDVDRKNRNHGTVMLPEVSDKKPFIGTSGFAVNKNGKHLELAYEFINGLLSDEMQLQLYYEGSQPYYPVDENIESTILSEEADKVKDPRVMETKAYALNQVKNGVIRIGNSTNLDFEALKLRMERELTKIIFSDYPYTEERLSEALQKLEDQYNLYLNE